MLCYCIDGMLQNDLALPLAIQAFHTGSIPSRWGTDYRNGILAAG